MEGKVTVRIHEENPPPQIDLLVAITHHHSMHVIDAQLHPETTTNISDIFENIESFRLSIYNGGL